MVRGLHDERYGRITCMIDQEGPLTMYLYNTRAHGPHRRIFSHDVSHGMTVNSNTT